DESGQECVVDLEECVKNWVQSHNENTHEFVVLTSEDSAAAWNSRCVGQRGVLDEPPWVEFTTKRRTRLEFGSYDEAYASLLGPLNALGWHTFDTDYPHRARYVNRLRRRQAAAEHARQF